MTSNRRRRNIEDRRELLAEVASLYYLGRLDQEQVAARVGVSRSTVSRMLARAHDTGVVEVRINRPVPVHEELQSRALREFPLRDAMILANAHDGDLLSAVGGLTGSYLDATLSDSATLAVGWGRSMRSVVDRLRPERRRETQVIQLIGAAGSLHPDVDGAEIARLFAERLGGQHYLLNVPLVVGDPVVAEKLRRERSVATVLGAASRAELALVGLGTLEPESSPLLRAGYVRPEELAAATAAGAVGDVCGHFLASSGEILDIPLARRTLGLSVAALRGIPRVVAVGVGRDKVGILGAALRSGLVNVIATDSTTMAAVLDQQQR